MGKQRAEEKQQTYKNNSHYEPEVFCALFDRWLLARRDGDERERSRCINEIYDYLKDFIYHTLWKHFPQQMANEEARAELIQDYWVEVMEALPGYNHDKARVTTFLMPYVYSAGRAYYSQLYHTTGHYANVRGALEKAVNRLLLEGENEPEIDTLVRRTGIPKVTVERVCEEMEVDRSICSLESSFAEIDSILPSQEGNPEKIILQKDLKEAFEVFQEKLSGEEALLFKIMQDLDANGNDKLSGRKLTACFEEEARKDLILCDKKYSRWKVMGIMRRLGKRLYLDMRTRDYSYIYCDKKTG